MKRWKKIKWSLLPLLVLLFALGSVCAQAEDLLATADGWQYRLLPDGRAELLGHADETAVELTIPMAVDGVWVAAVGENTFGDHAALRAVTVPSTVTDIADGAFGDNTSLTLRAFNGTEALEYAEKTGLASVNLSEYDFFDDIIDLSDMTGGWGLEKETTLVIQAPFDVLVTPGAEIYLPVNPVYPAGYPVKVLSAEAGEGFVTARVEALDFMDAVESYYAENVVFTFDPEDFIPGPGITVLPNLSAEARAEGSVASAIPLGASFEQSYGDAFSINGSFSLSLSFTASIAYEKFELKMVSTDVTLSHQISVGATGKKDGEIYLGEAPVLANGVISAMVEFKLYYNVSGEVSFKAEQKVGAVNTWTPETGMQTSRTRDPAHVGSLNISGTAEAGFIASPVVKLGFGGGGVDLLWIDVKGGVFVTSAYTSLAPFCNDISWGLFNTIDYGVGWRSNKMTVAYFSGRVYEARAVIQRWHLEGLEKIVQDHCTYAGICTVSFVTNGNAIDPIMRSAGEPLGYVEEPVRTGYVFRGWYADPGLTQWFDLDAELPEGTLTLYAKWEGDSATYAPPAAPEVTPPPTGDGQQPTDAPLVVPTPVPNRPSDWVQNWDSGSNVPTEPPQASGTVSIAADCIDFTVDEDGYASISGIKPYTFLETSNYPIRFDYTSTYSLTVPSKVENALQRRRVGSVFGDPEDENDDGDLEFLYHYIYYDNDVPVQYYPVKSVSIYGSSSYSNGRATSISTPPGLESVSISSPYLQSATIGSGTKYVSIGGSYYLTSLTLHNVDELYLYGNVNLTSLTVTNDANHMTVVHYESNRFKDSLRTLYLERCVLDGAFNFCDELEQVTLKDCSVYNSFTECPTLTSVDISITDGSTYECKYAFNDCPLLSDINVSRGVEPVRSFNGCSTEKAVTLEVPYLDAWSFDVTPLHLTIIPGYTYAHGFSGRANLLSFRSECGEDLYLTDDAFADCTGLRYCELPGTWRVYGDLYAGELFSGCRDVELVVGVDTDTIRDYLNEFLYSSAAADSADIFSSIRIDPGVTHIGISAFYRMSAIRGDVVLPSGLRSIDSYAFCECPNMTSVTIPSGVEEVGNWVFYHSDGLTSVEINAPGAVYGSNVFAMCDKLRDISINGAEQMLGYRMFANCPSITSVHIPAEAKDWAYGVYSSCDNIENVTFDASLTAIPDALFYRCDSIAELRLPSGLKEIGSDAFSYTAITELSIPSGVTSIGGDAFSYCEALTEIELPDRVIEYGYGVFRGCDSLTSIEIPGVLDVVPERMFEYCDGLERVVIGEGVTKVGESAFNSCKALKELTLPSTLTSIGSSAFAGSTNLNYVILPDGLTELEDYAFQYSGLISLDLPASLTKVGYASLYMSRLTMLYVRNPALEFVDMSFRWPYVVEGMTIFCDEESTIASHVINDVNQWDDYVVLQPLDKELYSVTYLNGMYTSWSTYHVDTVYDGMLLTRPEPPRRNEYTFTGWYVDPECTIIWDFDKDEMPKDNLLLYSGWTTGATGNWESYGDDLIYTGYDSSFIIVPGSVGGQNIVAIAPDAFGASVITVDIPATVMFIDPDAFAGASRLREINVDENNPFFYSVEGVLFAADGTLLKYPACKQGEAYITPEGTTGVGAGAFSGLEYLETLTLSAGVKTLDANAIMTGKLLKSITFTTDLTSVDPAAIVGLKKLFIYTPEEAPVLQAYLAANGADWNLSSIVFSVNGAGVMAGNAKAGALLPEGLVPDNDSFATAEKLMLGWSPTASADDLWNFASDVVPAGDLTLFAVFRDAYEYAVDSNGVTLTKYNGTAKRVEIPMTIRGAKVTAIAPDCFGETAGMTFLGENYKLVQSWVNTNGGTYEAMMCTVVFVTGCEAVFEPVNALIGQKCALPIPQRYGYYFSCWDRSDVSDTCYDQLLVDRKEIILTARWYTSSSNTSGEALFNYELNDEGAVITRYIHVNANAAPIPDTIGGYPVVGIADGAFSGCSIASVTIPATVTFIGDYAFENCVYLTDVTLPASLTAIGGGAFSGCIGLTELVLPAGIESLPPYAFAYCSGITAIELPAALKTIGDRAFIGCSKLAALTVEEGSTSFTAVDGVLYSADGKELLIYPAGKTDTAFAVPDGVASIEAYAMAGSRIASLTLPASLKDIGSSAFSSCPGLTSVVFPDEGSIAIGPDAFSGCMNLVDVTITGGVSSIASGAFTGCKLKSVTLGGCEPTIEAGAFSLTAETLVYSDSGSFGADWASGNGAIAVTPDDILPTRISLFDVYIQVGEKLQIVPQFTPEDATITHVRWSTSSADRDIATVDENGVLTAWQPGNALVYGYLPGNLDSDYFYAYVYEKPQDVQKIELSATELAIRPGEAKRLTAELTPFGEEEILWSSTDETVAYYDEDAGTVVALKEGKAAITAYTESGVRASCLVEVTDVWRENGPIVLEVDYLELELNHGTTIYAEIQDDEHYEDEIYWMASNPEALMLESFGYHGEICEVYAMMPGMYEVAAYTDCGYLAKCTVVVTYTPRLTLSTDYIEIGADWNTSSLYLVEIPDTSTEITWYSADPDIAYYDAEAERLFGVKEGETEVWVETDDGYTASCHVEVVKWGCMYLPAGLKSIEEEAFVGSNAFYIECCDGLETIGSRAFADNTTLQQIVIPASVNSIASDAFEGCTDFYWVIGYSGSYAEQWAEENGYGFSSLD